MLPCQPVQPFLSCVSCRPRGAALETTGAAPAASQVARKPASITAIHCCPLRCRPACACAASPDPPQSPGLEESPAPDKSPEPAPAPSDTSSDSDDGSSGLSTGAAAGIAIAGGPAAAFRLPFFCGPL